jgi:hypothetical protein
MPGFDDRSIRALFPSLTCRMALRQRALLPEAAPGSPKPAPFSNALPGQVSPGRCASSRFPRISAGNWISKQTSWKSKMERGDLQVAGQWHRRIRPAVEPRRFRRQLTYSESVFRRPAQYFPLFCEDSRCTPTSFTTRPVATAAKPAADFYTSSLEM